MPITYFAIRLDAPDSPEPYWPHPRITSIHNALKSFGIITHRTYGREIAKKTKKEHIHLHFALEHELPLKKGMSSWIKRHTPDGTLEPYSYSIQTHTKTVDREWYGYVFKDYEEFDKIPLSFQIGFSITELREMWAAAKALRVAAVKKFEKFENKMNNDMEVRAKTWAWLDAELPNLDVHKNAGITTREQDPAHVVAVKLVEYHRVYNNYKIPMDLKRRVVQYLSHRGYPDWAVANYILK